MITRPAFRYHGSKHLLSGWIIGHIPYAHDAYVEPFGGSAAVLLQKARSPLEIYNDLNEDVVNFFRVLREQPEELIRAIRLTPFAKREWELSFEETAEPLEKARRFYARAYMSIAGATTQNNPGFRRQKVLSKGINGDKKMTPAAVSFTKVDHLYQVAERMTGVQIEADDALGLIQRYDAVETIFYVDPPYVFETRGRWKDTAYTHEMSDAQHVELAETLQACQGMVILSGYACPLYADLYEATGWRRVDRQTRINGPGSAVETLWLNPAVQIRLGRGQLSLW